MSRFNEIKVQTNFNLTSYWVDFSLCNIGDVLVVGMFDYNMWLL